MTTTEGPLLEPGLIARLAELLEIDVGELIRDLFRLGGRIAVIWLLAWLAILLLRAIARRIEQAMDDGNPLIETADEKRGRTLAQLVRYVGRLTVVAIAMLMSVNVFVDIGPLLAGAGILGLAVSFGAQSLVKDVIAGFFILVENQFSVGDVIEAAGKSGSVEKMSLRLVTLRDTDGRVHMIPSGEIKVVSNLTRGWSRAVVDLSVPYEGDVDQALAIVADEAKKFEADPAWTSLFDGTPEVVGVNDLGESALVIRTLLRTQPGKQWAVQREFRRRMVVRFQHENIATPYHQRRVQVQVQAAPGQAAPALSTDQVATIAGGAA